MTILAPDPITPTRGDIERARMLTEYLDTGNPSISIILSEQGNDKTISLSATECPALASVLLEIAKGRPVVVVPLDEEISTQQAAELLNVSRPFLIKLLENNEIPFRTVGSWRRVKVADLLAYKRRDEAKRDSALQELADQAQDLNLGY